VSHNMQAVSVLCNRGMFLREGSLEYTGSIKEAIAMYTASFVDANGQEDNPERRQGSGEYRFTGAGPTRQFFEATEEKVIQFEIQRRGSQLVGRMWVCALIVDANGVVVAQCDSRLLGFSVQDFPLIQGKLRFTTPWLKPGTYRVDLRVGAHWMMDIWEGACSLIISPVLPYAHSSSPYASASGLVFADFSFEASESKEAGVSSAVPNFENVDRLKTEHSALEV
jgi:lipopolysaccharide transport system ATP-binding protein